MISYITTAIPYVNARPHLGHALELVQADVLARHQRLRGHQVRFLTGTDDNALKNVTAARAAGVPVEEFVRSNGDAFLDVAGRLGVCYDDLIRTGSDPRHRPGVERLWRRVTDDLHRRSYTGHYCAGCEQFYQPEELAGGRCPEHGSEPEEVTEENWFFALSRYQQQIEKLITSGRVRVQPDHRRAEVLSFVRSGLADFSVSRPSSRTGGWGIAVPGEEDQTIYVWWDALANYITALRYGDDHADPWDYQRWWIGSDHRTHVIGKGIARFHAVYWLGTLLAAGEPLPTTIAVHEYLQLSGHKISKSAGSTAPDPSRPEVLLDQFGRDAVRWWLVSDVNRVGDTEFTVDRLRDRYHQDLANTIGNLVNRTVSLTHRGLGGVLPDHDQQTPVADELVAAIRAAEELPGRIDGALDQFDHRQAAGLITRTAAAANAAIESVAPWRLTGRSLAATLSGLITICRTIATELSPFVPDGAARLATALGTGARVGDPVPAFRRLEES
jgi:methionyl-tRNA synthetase